MPLNEPDRGATNITMNGQAVITTPVSTAFIPKVCSSRKGIPTSASIWAVYETILVITDIENIGMRSRSNGSIGYLRLSCVLT